jgi:hypothetical protein
MTTKFNMKGTYPVNKKPGHPDGWDRRRSKRQ